MRENLPAIATDETRAGERGMSPFELRKMMSGGSTYDLGHIPRVVSGRLVLRWGMLNDCTAGKGNLSVADIGHLKLRHVRSPGASPPRHPAFENIGPLLHGCDYSRRLEKRISHKNLSMQNVDYATGSGSIEWVEG